MKSISRYTILFFFAAALMACGDRPSETGPTDPVEQPDTSPTAPAAAPEQATERPSPPTLEDDFGLGKDATLDQKIATVRERYAEVMAVVNGPAVDTRETVATCSKQDGEVSLTRHFNDSGQLVMLEATEGIGHQFTTTKYYFRNQIVFFAYEIEEYFGPSGNGPATADGEGVNWEGEITETRYYIDGVGDGRGKTIRKLKKSWKENSWTENPDPDTIPNIAAPVGPAESYPNADVLRNWMSARIDC